MKYIDVAHLYVGVKGLAQNECYTGELETVKGVHGDIIITNHDEITIRDFKPILRRLNSITDDEFKEVVFLFYGIDNRDIVNAKVSKVERYSEVKQANKFGTSIPYRCLDEKGTPIMRSTLSSNQLTPEQFYYLLSIGVDLFRLIESDEAIDFANGLKTETL